MIDYRLVVLQLIHHENSTMDHQIYLSAITKTLRAKFDN